MTTDDEPAVVDIYAYPNGVVVEKRADGTGRAIAVVPERCDVCGGTEDLPTLEDGDGIAGVMTAEGPRFVFVHDGCRRAQ